MYGVVEISGHQYMVKPGDLIDVQKLNQREEGEIFDIDNVLFVKGEETLVGKPLVEGAKVKVKVIRHDRSRKVIVFKRKPGAYRKKNGHRQHFTALLVTEILDGKGNAVKIEEDSFQARKYLGSPTNKSAISREEPQVLEASE